MAKQVYRRRTIKGFKCRIDKKPYVVGSIYESTDKARINELVKKGHIDGEEVKTTQQAKDKVVEDNLEAKTVEELKALADADKKVKVEATGKNGAVKKEDYIRALKRALKG